MPLSFSSPGRFLKRPDTAPMIPSAKIATGATLALTQLGDLPGRSCAKSKANVHFRIYVDARVDDATKPDERCYTIYDQTWYTDGTKWKPYTVGDDEPGFVTSFNTAGLSDADLELVPTVRAVSSEDPNSGELVFSLKSKTKNIVVTCYIEAVKVPANSSGLIE